jgi:hypothetical protein
MFQNSRTLDILLKRFQCTPLGPKLTFWVFGHHFGALNCLFGFAPYTLRPKLVFQVVSRHFVAAPDPLWKSVSSALNARVYASKTISCFVAMNMPNPLFQSKTHVLGGSMPFRSRTWHVAKTGIEAHLTHEFVPLEPFLFFCSKHAQYTTFGLKLIFWMVSCHFVAAPNPLRKLASGYI